MSILYTVGSIKQTILKILNFKKKLKHNKYKKLNTDYSTANDLIHFLNISLN